MLKLKDIKIVESKKELEALPEGKLLINTINAHSYNTALKDVFFAEALMKGDALIPDGASIVMACRKLKAKSQPTERIAGWDLFAMEMERLNQKGGTCFFMGSSEKVLNLIREKAKTVYPNIRIETYSPPYKPEFSEEENRAIYNPQIQISVVSGTKRSIFRQKNKTKRSKKRLHTTLIKPEQKVNEDLCSGFIVS